MCCSLYSRLDSRYEPLVSAVEADILRLFLVTAHSAKRSDKIAEFFKLYGTQLLRNSTSRAGIGPEDSVDWKEWFLLPYLQHPEREQRFQVWLKLPVSHCSKLPYILKSTTIATAQVV